MELSNFEKLQILRDQQEERTAELSELEIKIRTLQSQLATQRYLEGLSPYYAMTAKDLPAPSELEKMKERKAILQDLLQTIEQQIPATLERAQGQNSGETPPTAASVQPKITTDGQVRKKSFDF